MIAASTRGTLHDAFSERIGCYRTVVYRTLCLHRITALVECLQLAWPSESRTQLFPRVSLLAVTGRERGSIRTSATRRPLGVVGLLAYDHVADGRALLADEKPKFPSDGIDN